MPMLEDHGGGCCGISHIWEFEELKEYANKQAALTVLDRQLRQVGAERLAEVVLTDEQLRLDKNFWANALKSRGFRLVTRFRNRNSGNICNVFHKCIRIPVGNNKSRRFRW